MEDEYSFMIGSEALGGNHGKVPGFAQCGGRLGRRYYVSGCREDVTKPRTLSGFRTGWVSKTRNHIIHKLVGRSLRQCRTPVSIEDTTNPVPAKSWRA